MFESQLQGLQGASFHRPSFTGTSMTQLMDEKLAVQSNKNAEREFDFGHNQQPIQKPIVIH